MSILSSLLGGLGAKVGGGYQAQSQTGKNLAAQYSGTSSQNVNPYITPEYLALLGQQQAEYGQLAGQVEPGYAGLLNQALGNVQNYGQAQRTQLANFYKQQQAQQQADLLNRGLGNSTIANSVQSGLAQQQAQAGQNLEQNISQYGTNVLGQFGLPMLENQYALGMGAIGAETGVGQQYLGLLGTQGTSLQTNAGVGSTYNVGQGSGYGLSGNLGFNAGQFVGGQNVGQYLGQQNPQIQQLLGGNQLGGGVPQGGYQNIGNYGNYYGQP
jgi:hypothetical protein